MSSVENIIQELSKLGMIQELNESLIDWKEFLNEIKETLSQIFQTLKTKIQTIAASNPLQLEKEVNIELKSTDQYLNGSKVEVSILSGDSYQCPFGVLPEELKDSLLYMSYVFNAKNEGSAIILNEKINTLLLPEMVNHDTFKSIFEPNKDFFVKKIGSQIHIILSKEVPSTLKELTNFAIELFTSSQNGFKMSNVLLVETAFKINNLMHMNLDSFLSQLTTLYVNYNSKVSNFDFLIDIIIEKLAYMIDYDYSHDDDMISFLMVINLIRVVKSVSMDVNFHPFGKIAYELIEGETDEQKMQEFEKGKEEMFKCVKEFKDFLFSIGLKEYMDLIDFDQMEFHLVKPLLKIGLNVKVNIPGLSQLICE